MKGRGRITLPTEWVEITETGTGCLGEFDVAVSFGDYGRHDNPTITGTAAAGASFTFEFASPDDARRIGEQLLALARAAEEKIGQRGPEYRRKLAIDEALTEMRELTKRVEAAMGVESPVEGVTVHTTKFASLKA